MEKELVFHILEIDGLTDERSIKAAYMKKLKVTNPEDDPEGFRKLREAYEQALLLLQEAQEGNQEEEKEKTDIDLWIDQADEIYQDFRRRGDVKEWKRLLDAEVCQGLDSSLDAREAMMVYLMSHFYLPKEVWRCLDREFQFVEDQESLKERYPADFLDYIIHYTEYEYFIDFSRMKLREDNRDGADINVDGYIKAYMELRGLCDQKDFEGAPLWHAELRYAEKVRSRIEAGRILHHMRGQNLPDHTSGRGFSHRGIDCRRPQKAVSARRSPWTLPSAILF